MCWRIWWNHKQSLLFVSIHFLYQVFPCQISGAYLLQWLCERWGPPWPGLSSSQGHTKTCETNILTPMDSLESLINLTWMFSHMSSCMDCSKPKLHRFSQFCRCTAKKIKQIKKSSTQSLSTPPQTPLFVTPPTRSVV